MCHYGHTRKTCIHKTPCVTNLKPVRFISAESWSTTAHFVVDTPPTGIVCLETLTATVGQNMDPNNMYMSGSLTEAHIIDRVTRAHVYVYTLLLIHIWSQLMHVH